MPSQYGDVCPPVKSPKQIRPWIHCRGNYTLRNLLVTRKMVNTKMQLVTRDVAYFLWKCLWASAKYRSIAARVRPVRRSAKGQPIKTEYIWHKIRWLPSLRLYSWNIHNSTMDWTNANKLKKVTANQEMFLELHSCFDRQTTAITNRFNGSPTTTQPRRLICWKVRMWKTGMSVKLLFVSSSIVWLMLHIVSRLLFVSLSTIAQWKLVQTGLWFEIVAQSLRTWLWLYGLGLRQKLRSIAHVCGIKHAKKKIPLN